MYMYVSVTIKYKCFIEDMLLIIIMHPNTEILRNFGMIMHLNRLQNQKLILIIIKPFQKDLEQEVNIKLYNYI